MHKISSQNLLNEIYKCVIAENNFPLIVPQQHTI